MKSGNKQLVLNFNEQIQYRYLVLRGIYLIFYFTDFHVWFIMDKERVTAEVILELKKAQDALKESQRTASSY